MNDKLHILFQLGSLDTFQPWPDYLDHGFTHDDVPALTALFSDQALLDADEDDKDGWVLLHAWRTLGQLKSAAAVQPLLNALEPLVNDDAASEELPKVMGMIGAAAIPDLTFYLQSTGHGPFSQTLVMDALVDIYKQDPTVRDEIIDLLIQQIKTPHSDPWVNGCTIASLMDLKAVEAIEPIREIIAAGHVDVGMCGDIEDVEIELDLRDERETPKPHYHLESLRAELKEPDENDLHAVLEYCLIKYGNSDSIHSISKLDGFLAAVLSSRETCLPSAWLPAIWGGEDNSPEWPSMEEAQRFHAAIMTFYNNVASDLSDNVYEPIFLEWGTGKNTLMVSTWCDGYLLGMKSWRGVTEQDTQYIKPSLEPIIFFTKPELWRELDESSDDSFGALQLTIEPAATRIYRYFIEQHRAAMTVQRTEPKVGRNDPCPCGSGKKYKKCCLH